MENKSNIFQDGKGNWSSFRIVWCIAVLAIVFVWAYVSCKQDFLAPWPLDGMTTTAIFGGPGLKTFSESWAKS